MFKRGSSTFGSAGVVGLVQLWPPPGTPMAFATGLVPTSHGIRVLRYLKAVSWSGEHMSYDDPQHPGRINFLQDPRPIPARQRLKSCTIRAMINKDECKCAVYAVFDM